MLLIQYAGLDWTHMAPAAGLPYDIFCEGDRGGSMRQPINTWSNLPFFVVGAWILSAVRASKRPVFDGLFALNVLFIGASSAFYHASLSFTGQILDLLAIYLLPTLLMLDAASTLTGRPVRVYVPHYLLFNAALTILIFNFPGTRRPLVALLAGALLLVELRVRKAHTSPRDQRLLAAALLCFMLAFAFWIPDRFQFFCYPADHPLGHAVWHLLSAVAAYLLFRYSVSGEEVTCPPNASSV